MKKYYRILQITALFFMASTGAQAELKKVMPQDEKVLENAAAAKIYFTAGVSTKSVSELIQAIDNLNANYKSLKKIYLYISSYGGDMDSGYAGYWAVKSSHVPITTVNLSTVMSSATMIFCGAKDRQSRKGGRFIMHPPYKYYKNRSFQPDELTTAGQDLKGYVSMFTEVYRECSRYSDAEISTLLSSENDRKFLLPDEAKEKGIISGVAGQIMTAPIAYYITDDGKND
ncbi:ATP-dependent Clp protease proteolytic subunit [Ochrobactrum sp. SFR4]|uniref:ATP-dependent Clp protease proteolytic subunit n=1 Tax=Ochrobactrum sp. SFR4 TaxID=2717368 RepID=UPI001C8B2D58|nr:peptidase S14 [Ochrobactrum sp. SFR4]